MEEGPDDAAEFKAAMEKELMTLEDGDGIDYKALLVQYMREHNELLAEMRDTLGAIHSTLDNCQFNGVLQVREMSR